MLVRCPNKACNTKLVLQDSLLKNPSANAKCPSCKKYFKPFDTLSEQLKKELLASQENSQSHHQSEPHHLQSSSEETLTHEVGWLIVHDENTPIQTYSLKLGKQLVGRKSSSLPCFIMIETKDRRMHRNHFYIIVQETRNGLSYCIESHKSSADGNGTFVDTKRLNGFEREMRRLSNGEQIYLEDGALIQAGDTKIVLKTAQSVTNKADATQIVSQQKINKTIIL